MLASQVRVLLLICTFCAALAQLCIARVRSPGSPCAAGSSRAAHVKGGASAPAESEAGIRHRRHHHEADQLRKDQQADHDPRTGDRPLDELAGPRPLRYPAAHEPPGDQHHEGRQPGNERPEKDHDGEARRSGSAEDVRQRGRIGDPDNDHQADDPKPDPPDNQGPVADRQPGAGNDPGAAVGPRPQRRGCQRPGRGAGRRGHERRRRGDAGNVVEGRWAAGRRLR